jgi:hypothetical protein
VFWIIIAAAAASPGAAQAGEPIRPAYQHKNMITGGLMFAPLGLRGRYQRVLTEQLSVLVAGGFGARTDWFSSGYDVKRISGTLGADFQPMKMGLHGFYFGPRVSYQVWSLEEAVEENPQSYSRTTAEFDLAAGWRWVTDPGFSLTVGLNGGYTVVDQEDNLDNVEILSDRDSGFYPGVDLALGWSF